MMEKEKKKVSNTCSSNIRARSFYFPFFSASVREAGEDMFCVKLF